MFNTENSHDSCDSSSSAYRRRAQSIEWPPRKQPRTIETIEVGCLNVISGKYEVRSLYVLILFGMKFENKGC